MKFWQTCSFLIILIILGLQNILGWSPGYPLHPPRRRCWKICSSYWRIRGLWFQRRTRAEWRTRTKWRPRIEWRIQWRWRTVGSSELNGEDYLGIYPIQKFAWIIKLLFIYEISFDWKWLLILGLKLQLLLEVSGTIYNHGLTHTYIPTAIKRFLEKFDA